jgi:hypothetical protein
MEPGKREIQPGYYLTGQVVAAYGNTVGNAYMRSLQGISGAPANGISQGSTCISLPARSPALRGGVRGIFDQPEKNEFLNKLFMLDPLNGRVSGRGRPSTLHPYV